MGTKSKKFIFFTDFHAHIWTEFSTPDEEYINSRVKEQIEVLQQVFQLAEENQADIIFGGDLFHQRGKVDTRVLNLVFEEFRKAIKRNKELNIHMIPGNHDKVTNSLNSESSIDIFQALDRVNVYIEPTELKVADNIVIDFIPYGDETEQIKEYLARERNTEEETNILVAHLGIEGSSTGKSSHRLGGAFSYGDLMPDFYDYILLGHYHKRQILGEGQNHKHIYGGSVMQYSFSDEGQNKGVHLLTINEDKSKNKLEYIEIKSTMFKTVHANNIPNNMEEVLNNHYVRFQGNTKQARALENVVEDLSHVRLEVDKDYEVETRINIDTSSSPEQIVREYASEYYPNAIEESLECIREVL